MTWFVLSLSTAFANACRDAWMKTKLGDYTHYEILGLSVFFCLPPLAAALFFIPVPKLDYVFWLCVVLAVIVDFISYLLYLVALKLSPLSLVVPFTAFTPVGVIVVAWIILGETPTLWGLAGIGLIVAGAWIVSLDGRKDGILAPLRNLLREKGSMYMLGSAILFSLSAVLGKVGIMHSSPVFFGLFFALAFSLTIFITLLATGRINARTLAKNYRIGLVGGFFIILETILHSLAISLTKAAYMLAVKRTSILFGIIFGAVLFKEKNIRIRLAGGALMFAGTLLIALGGR